MSIKTHLNFLELTYKKKRKYSVCFFVDETDVDSYFSHNFLDFYVVPKRVLRLSKGLFRKTYSIKECTFDPIIAYQIYKLTAGLYVTRKEIIFFILENLKLKRKSYDNTSRTFSIPIQLPNFSELPKKVFYSSISLKILKVQNLA